MCVIIVKRKGIELPTDLLLYKAAKINHDGCGFVSSNGSYYRSLDYNKFADKFYKDVSKEDSCIIHFRWATQGSTRICNCHPFYKHGIYFAHNGVLPYYPQSDETDSQYAFEKYLLPIINDYGFTKYSKAFIDSVRGNSRFAFMQDGKIYLYGDYKSYYGLLLSNTYFM